MPSYPKTSIEGVGHFIHIKNPVALDGPTDAYGLAKELMSKVCYAYARHTLLTLSRFNSLLARLAKEPLISRFMEIGRVDEIVLTSHGISHISVLE